MSALTGDQQATLRSSVVPPSANLSAAEETFTGLRCYRHGGDHEQSKAQLADPALFPASSVSPKFECMEPPNDCPHATKCPEFGGACLVIDCHQGSCPGCPDFMKNLISKGWCSYAHMKGTEIVVGAFILQTVSGPTNPFCSGR